MRLPVARFAPHKINTCLIDRPLQQFQKVVIALKQEPTQLGRVQDQLVTTRPLSNVPLFFTTLVARLEILAHLAATDPMKRLTAEAVALAARAHTRVSQSINQRTLDGALMELEVE